MSRARVLLVDDNELNREIASCMLEEYEIDVMQAESGTDALEKLETNEFDLIFMDIRMPGPDGIETTQIIRDGGRDVTVIAMTGEDDEEQRGRMLAVGMNDIIDKPVEADRLKEVINKYLKCTDGKDIRDDLNESESIIYPCQEANLPGFDKSIALNYSQNYGNYQKYLENFYKLIDDKADKIEELFNLGNIKDFTTEVHALKSTSRALGNMELSEYSARLEKYGNDNDIEMLKKCVPVLLSMYRECKNVLEVIIPGNTKLVDFDDDIFANYLDELYEALDKFDIDKADRLVLELEGIDTPEKYNDYIKKLSGMVADVDMGSAMELIDEIKKID